MRLLILRSKDNGTVPDPYAVKMDTAYADRVIGHLSDTGAYCSACQDDCIGCRGTYELDRSADSAGEITVPAVLPVMLDDPEEYLPETVPEHDILLAIAVHEEVIISFVRQFPPKALIVPLEESGWLSSYGKGVLEELGRESDFETAFPKPFCSLKAADGLLRAFVSRFRIGYPRFELHTADNRAEQVSVACSAPCGATYYVARHLAGRELSDDFLLEADARLSGYPCTAGHGLDREFNDSITHQAVKLQRIALCAALQTAGSAAAEA